MKKPTKEKFVRMDLKNFATKDDLKNFATKDDFSELVLAVQKTDRDIQTMQKTINTKLATKDDVQVILNTIDAFTKKVTVVENKGWFHDHRFDELEPKVQNHELRLAALESIKGG